MNNKFVLVGGVVVVLGVLFMTVVVWVAAIGAAKGERSNLQAAETSPETAASSTTPQEKQEDNLQAAETSPETTTSPTSQEKQEAPGDAASEVTCAVDQACDLGVSSVTVTSVQQTPTVKTLGETLEGNFVVVEFDYTYGGNAPVDVDQPTFRLTDQDGNTYSLNSKATIYYGNSNDRSLVYETVQPGVTTPGTAIFQVAPEAAGFTLLVVDLVSPQENKSARIPL
ncbi:MAG: hypothetical protein CYG60_13805 [Actinobacteria bacterium]|nr:MAG: hypothetical protein CYG60_13805 [Actinomycetota bacterium]